MDKNILAAALQPAFCVDNSSPDDLVNEEGLRVCAVCGEKKQEWFFVDGIIPKRKRSRPCRCAREKKEAEEAEEKQRQRMQRIEYYRKKGLADEQYRACTFAVDDQEDAKASQFCRAYVDNWEWAKENNLGMLLWGDVGGGKTFLAACIANALIDKEVQVKMTSIPRLVSEMTKDFGAERENVLKMIATTPLLILDDVGTERNTEYSNEQVYEIINERYKAKKPLIVTTNLPMETLRTVEDMTKKRIYERIVEMCPPCKVVSSGRRQKTARSKYEQMREKFGL